MRLRITIDSEGKREILRRAEIAIAHKLFARDVLREHRSELYFLLNSLLTSLLKREFVRVINNTDRLGGAQPIMKASKPALKRVERRKRFPLRGADLQGDENDHDVEEDTIKPAMPCLVNTS